MKIFIMSYNLLESTRNMAEFFVQCGHEPVIVDNDSSYPPLLKWLETCAYKVVSTKGIQLSTFNRFVWEIPNLLDDVGEFYCVTDCDLGFDGVPKDFCEVLANHIERSPGILKCGLSIRISDLPDNKYANSYRESESKNWESKDNYGFYGIPVDTTCAVYSVDRCNNIANMWRPENSELPQNFLDNSFFFRSHRSPEPYTCKHIQWYADINNLSHEQLYNLKIARHGSILRFKQVYAKELLEQYGIDEHWVNPATLSNI